MSRKSLLVLVSLLPALSAQAGDLYVGNFYTDSVSRFSPSGVNLGTFCNTHGTYPQSIALDSQGNLYVINKYDSSGSSPSHLRKFSPSGVDLGVITTGIAEYSVAVDRYDNVYVSKNGTIQRFNSNGTSLGTFYSGLFFDTRNMTFDNAGNLYFVNRNYFGITKVSPGGILVGQFPFAAGTDSPNGLAVDSTGNIYVSNYYINTIFKLGPDGTDLGIFANTGMDGPIGITFDVDGNLHVANSLSNSIHKFGPTGQDLGKFADTGLDSAPESLAFIPVQFTGDFNSDGKVDAADYVVWQKDPSRHGGQRFYEIWRSHFGDPASPAGGLSTQTAVPEPSTLLLLAVGAISLLGCRKAKSHG